MGIMVYSLLWVMQDFVHQQYNSFGTIRSDSITDYSHVYVRGLGFWDRAFKAGDA